MLDKIRLAAAGKLPAAWEERRGDHKTGIDQRCCQFLKLPYAVIEAETLRGETSDGDLLEWAFANGRKPDALEIEVWNAFATKRGWRDHTTARLNERLAGIGLPPGTVKTSFDFIDLDEGRVTLAELEGRD